jgi:flagellar motor switch protein FliN/FliY
MDEMLSQEEINALLKGMDDEPAEPAEFGLTDLEKDAIGEVSNISMGTAATTLSSLVNKKVVITTPKVSICQWEDIVNQYDENFVAVQIEYKDGISGTNLLMLREDDVKIVSDLMMGGAGEVNQEALSELHMSAIGEAMNQMIGSSATSMSTMFEKKIDINPPKSIYVEDGEAENIEELVHFSNQSLIKVTFDMKVGELIDSELIQLFPIDFAKMISKEFIEVKDSDADDNQSASNANSSIANAKEQPAQQTNAMNNMGTSGQMNSMNNTGMSGQMNGMNNMGMPGQMNGMNNMGMPGQMNGMNNMGMPGQMNGMNNMGMSGQMNGMNNMGMSGQMNGMNNMGMSGQMNGMNNMGMSGQMNGQNQYRNIDVQQAQFQNFDFNSVMQQKENIDLIMDVPLGVTVELGRTHKSIKDILEFAPGTIIELNKLAGEPIDVLVNGKIVAKGEVVVIDENFGIRITEIVKQLEPVTY